jgi:four helix bundle protein
MDKKENFDFEKLLVYQKALDFVDLVYDQVKLYPREEKYSLSSQHTRAAISIPLNIAEGKGDTDKQFNRFLNIAKNSGKECVVCDTIAHRQKYIDEETHNDYRTRIAEILKMITRLQKSLK